MRTKMSGDDNEKEDENEMLREIRLVSGRKYKGTWNTIDKEGIGRYVTSNQVILEGEFRDGMLHGHGSMYWPRGQVIDGIWNRGKMEKEKRYTFADGLTYQEKKWNYCTFPDRRFYKCIVSGLRPAKKVLRTNDQPTKIIPPFCYDTGIGIFDPDKKCVLSYRNCKILHIPTTAESIWIREHCRKGWSAPVGHQTWLYKYFQSGAADFASLPQIPPENETENWWRRFDRDITRSQSVIHWIILLYATLVYLTAKVLNGNNHII